MHIAGMLIGAVWNGLEWFGMVWNAFGGSGAAAGMVWWRERYYIIHCSNAPKSKFGSENEDEKIYVMMVRDGYFKWSGNRNRKYVLLIESENTSPRF